MAETKTRRPRTPDPRTLGVGRDVLEARIAVLEPSVQRQENITDAMLSAWRPGGKENPDTSASGMLTYLCQLHRWHATGPEQPSSSKARWSPQDVADMRAALAAEPVHLKLEDGREVSVHPKSSFALQRLVYTDLALQFVAGARIDVETAEEQVASGLDVLTIALPLQQRLEREWAEIVCHPGPGLPWPETGPWEPELQPWSETLTIFDLLALRKAFLEVNLLRLHALSERTRYLAGREGQSDAMPMAAFLGIISGELGVQPREIARNWSLGEVFAQALVKWESHERATQKQDEEQKT